MRVTVLPSVVLLCCLASPVARAGDTWSHPYDGVNHLYRTTSSPKEHIHMLEVKLRVPGIKFDATASSERGKKTSDFAKLVKAQAAINGDFYGDGYATTGLAAGNGARWSDTGDGTTSGTFAFDKDTTRVELIKPSVTVTFDPTWMWGVVSGHPQVVAEGAVVQNTSGKLCERNPRTAIGLSQDGELLYMVVVDGRTSVSVGMTCVELGELMKSFGAYSALNLDGGGSSTMYISGAGVVNDPSGGSERTVGNHIALFAPKEGSIGTITGIVHDKSSTTVPIEGANVVIQSVAKDVSHADGSYSLYVVPETYEIVASKAGYLDTKLTQIVAAGPAVKLNIPLEKVALPPDGGGGDGDASNSDSGLLVDSPHDVLGDQKSEALSDAKSSDSTPSEGGQQASVDAGQEDGGCSCRIQGSAPSWKALALLAFALLGRRRRGRT